MRKLSEVKGEEALDVLADILEPIVTIINDEEVKAGFECGVVLDGFSDFNVDDTMEAYVIEEKKINYED